MKLSIIIPAFNEEKLLPGCLASVHAAVRANAAADWSAEVIVTDNNSTDRTAEVARQGGARVVFEPVNQIARARNAGARVATGDWFLFIDADSYLSKETLADLLRAIRSGRHAGGGCRIDVDDGPFPERQLIVFVWTVLSSLMRWAAGSFVFSRADAFRDVGGFPTTMFAAEEIGFSQRLQGWAGRRGLGVVILAGHPHVSSGRKLQLYGRMEMLRLLLRALCGPRLLRSREGLGIFYDGRR